MYQNVCNNSDDICIALHFKHFFLSQHNLPPGRVLRIVMQARCPSCRCQFVYRFAYLKKPLSQTSPNFLSMLTAAIAWSSSSSIVIRYVGPVPVLWMTSCFHKMGSMHTTPIPKQREHNSLNYCIDSNNKDQQLYIVDCAREQTLLSTISLLITVLLQWFDAVGWAAGRASDL